MNNAAPTRMLSLNPARAALIALNHPRAAAVLAAEPCRVPVGSVEARCRFYDRDEQVGPEQRNVAPALAYAMAQGWTL